MAIHRGTRRASSLLTMGVKTYATTSASTKGKSTSWAATTMAVTPVSEAYRNRFRQRPYEAI